MTHNHPVKDTDENFVIDPITRVITNADMRKTALMQYDHNSERLTFEIDRFIEGHDLMLCNKVEVHYDNYTSSRQYVSHGIYPVDDLAVCTDDERKITFTWLISDQATKFAGGLNFLVSFACEENDYIMYRWNTSVNNSISISSGIDNSDEVVETYADVLEVWKTKLFGITDTVEADIRAKIEEALAEIPGDYTELQSDINNLYNTSGDTIVEITNDIKTKCDGVTHDNLRFEYDEGIITATHITDSSDGNGGVVIPLVPKYNVVSFDILCVDASPSIGFKCTDTSFFHAAIYEKTTYTGSDWEHVEYTADPVGIQNLIDAGGDWNFYIWNAVPCNSNGYFVIKNLKFNGYNVSPLYIQNRDISNKLESISSVMRFGLDDNYPIIEQGTIDLKDNTLKVSVDNNNVSVEVVDNTYTGNGGYSYKIKDVNIIESIDFDVYASNSPINVGVLSSDFNQIIYADELQFVGRPVIYNGKHFHFEIPQSFKDYVNNLGLSAIFFIWNGPKCEICPRFYEVKNIVFNISSNYADGVSKYTTENAKYRNAIDHTSFRYYANDYDSFDVDYNNIGLVSTSPDDTTLSIFITSDLNMENVSNLLHIEFEASGVSNNDSKLYIWGTAKNSEDATNYVLSAVSDGEFEYILDLAWVDVYTNLDMSKPFRIQLSAKRSNLNASFNNVRVYCKRIESELISTDGSSIYDIINNVEKRMLSDSNISNVRKDYTVSPSGVKYILQVSDAGSLEPVPVVPNKALVIGNSLTLGFDTFGMAASDSSHDYYYYVNKAITEHKSDATMSRIAGVGFENCTSDDEYDTWFTSIESNLTSDLDLVIVQLIDNVNTEDKYNYFMSTGCKKLLSDIRSKCPNARVVWCGYWYSDSTEWNHVINCAKATGCETVYFGDLYLDDTNKSAIGNTYTTDDGQVITITSSGVASHPGNKGMRLIANRILYELGISDSAVTYDSSYDS